MLLPQLCNNLAKLCRFATLDLVSLKLEYKISLLCFCWYNTIKMLLMWIEIFFLHVSLCWYCFSVFLFLFFLNTYFVLHSDFVFKRHFHLDDWQLQNALLIKKQIIFFRIFNISHFVFVIDITDKSTVTLSMYITVLTRYMFITL